MKIKKTVPLVMVVSAVACGGVPIQRDGFTVEQDEMADAEKEITRRAAFDLSCDASQLKLTLLSVFDDAGPDMPTQIGVEGCGKKATYVRHVIDGPGAYDAVSGWEMNVAADSTPAQKP